VGPTVNERGERKRERARPRPGRLASWLGGPFPFVFVFLSLFFSFQFFISALCSIFFKFEFSSKVKVFLNYLGNISHYQNISPRVLTI
jgi:hypothetical protein